MIRRLLLNYTNIGLLMASGWSIFLLDPSDPVVLFRVRAGAAFGGALAAVVALLLFFFILCSKSIRSRTLVLEEDPSWSAFLMFFLFGIESKSKMKRKPVSYSYVRYDLRHWCAAVLATCVIAAASTALHFAKETIVPLIFGGVACPTLMLTIELAKTHLFCCGERDYPELKRPFEQWHQTMFEMFRQMKKEVIQDIRKTSGRKNKKNQNKWRMARHR